MSDSMSGAKAKQSVTSIAQELARAKRLALLETKKIETELTVALGAVERSAKKYPRQTAAVMLSLGVALGAAGALFLRHKSKNKKRS